MQVYRLKINRHICTGCNVCVVSCPINFDQLKNKSFLKKENAVILVKNEVAFDIYYENRRINCDGCGVCTYNCPTNALKVTEGVIQVNPDNCNHCLKCNNFCPLLKYRDDSTFLGETIG